MTPLLAHGLGDAGVLPLPLPLTLLAVGAAVLGYASWRLRQPAPGPASPDRRVRGSREGSVATEVRTAAPPLTVLRAVGLLAALAVTALALLGPASEQANPAVPLVLVVVWAGLVPLSLVAPGAWRAVSPLRAASALLARFTGDPYELGARPLPAGLGWWPGAAALAAFAVVEGPLRGDPTVLGVFLVLYGIVQLGLATTYGSGWYAHGEAFEILAQVVGRLSPVARDELTAPAPPGATAVVGVLAGSALADFVTDLPLWRGGTGAEIALLVAVVAATTGLVNAAARPRPLTAAVIPLAAAYLFAHYFTVLLVEGQVAFAQLGVLLRGGPAEISIDYDLLPGPLAATLQLLGFLAPHLVAAGVGIGLARAAYGRRAGAAVGPLLSILTLSVVGGTALRFGA